MEAQPGSARPATHRHGLRGPRRRRQGRPIQAFTENLNPRWARTVALSTPSDVKRGQWYFQRYIARLPTDGELVLFDRSWYNRAVVEHVFGWCTAEERERFFDQLPEFEDMLVADGIRLFKVWLAIGQAEQLRQFLQRERDPLKQWKLGQTDIDGLTRWTDYTARHRRDVRRSHVSAAPWTVIWGEDKRRARLAAMQAVLGRLDYPGRERIAAGPGDHRRPGTPAAEALSGPCRQRTRSPFTGAKLDREEKRCTRAFAAPLPGLPDPELDRQFYDGVPDRRLRRLADRPRDGAAVGVPMAIALRAGDPRVRLRALPARGRRRSACSTAPRPSPAAPRPGACASPASSSAAATAPRFDLPTAVLHTAIYTRLLQRRAVLQLISCVDDARHPLPARACPTCILGTTAINRPAD